MIKLYEGADVYKIVLTSGKELELTESELEELQSTHLETIDTLEKQVYALEAKEDKLSDLINDLDIQIDKIQDYDTFDDLKPVIEQLTAISFQLDKLLEKNV